MFHLLSSEFSAVAQLLVLLSVYWLFIGDFNIFFFASFILAQRITSMGRKHQWKRDPSRKEARVAIVTGANAGVGLAAARGLASKGVKVVMGCRSKEKAEEAMGKIRKVHPSAELVFVADLDLSNFDCVRRFAQEFDKSGLPLNLLVNNAGVLRFKFGSSFNGHETTIATNFLGHLLLTELLMPKLMASASPALKSRVINVSSCAHTKIPRGSSPVNLVASLHGPRAATSFSSLGGVKVYALSKLLNLYTTAVHSRKYPDVISVSVHPGIIASGLYQGLLPSFVIRWFFYYPSLLLFKTVSEGAETILHCCGADDVKSGGYFFDCRNYGMGTGACCMSEVAQNPANAWAAYDWGMKELGLKQ